MRVRLSQRALCGVRGGIRVDGRIEVVLGGLHLVGGGLHARLRPVHRGLGLLHVLPCRIQPVLRGRHGLLRLLDRVGRIRGLHLRLGGVRRGVHLTGHGDAR